MSNISKKEANKWKSYQEKLKNKSIFNVIEKYLKVITALVAIISGTFNGIDWYNNNKKIEIQVQENIDLSLIFLEDKSFDAMTQLFKDEVDENKKYCLENVCTTNLILTNHYDTNIAISEVILDVNEIKADYIPRIVFRNCMSPIDGVIYIAITNKGWSDVKKLKCTSMGKNADLDEYFHADVLKFTIPKLKIGERIEIPFLINIDLVKASKEITCFVVDFEAKCVNEDIVNVVNDYMFYIEE